jgi:choloylglycine hydrolase
MKRKLLTLGCLIIYLIFVFSLSGAEACTIFNVKGQTGNYFASNEDWVFTDPALRVVPGNKNDYGYLVFGWNSYLPGYPQGGVNEQGVCLDLASLTPQNFQDDPARKALDENLIYKILKQCKNTGEAIALIRQYNCSQLAGEHLLVADREGDSCIVEWSGKDYVFLRRKKNYQVITNFCVSNPKIGWYPCSRFKTADETLTRLVGSGKPNRKGLTFEAVKDILKETHQEGSYPTIYSYIVVQKSLDLYIFYNHDYSKYRKINIPREIKKGTHQIELYYREQE